MSNLADIMESVSRQLRANIEASRQSFLHNATKGDAVENAVRSFLRRHLPDSIGVAHGHVADRFGNVSTQLDVILYDAQRTPILYMDEAKENRLIPAEGVVAAIECKTNLRLDELRTLAKSAETLKSLDRSAYYKSSEVFISKVVRAYGREWDVIPPMYFVLAFPCVSG